MTLEEFVAICNKRDWPELIQFLSSNIKDLSFKVAVSAFIGAHHPDAEKAKANGLSVWDTKLSADLVTPAFSLFTSAVHLGDFTNAHILATHVNVLNDAKVGDAIVAYVKANKKRFGQWFFDSKQVDDKLKEAAKEAFGDFNFSKSEREAYMQQQFMKRAQDKITYLQAIDCVTQQLEKILNIRPNLFRVRFEEPASQRGISMFSRGDGGEILFNKSVSKEAMQQHAKTLETLGIKAHYYNYYHGCGIELSDKPDELAKKLEECKSDPKDELKTSSTLC